MVVYEPGAVMLSPMSEAVVEFLGSLERRGASFNTITAYRSDLRQLERFMETSRAGEAQASFDKRRIISLATSARCRLLARVASSSWPVPMILSVAGGSSRAMRRIRSPKVTVGMRERQ